MVEGAGNKVGSREIEMEVEGSGGRELRLARRAVHGRWDN
jgi:hypothetical protein